MALTNAEKQAAWRARQAANRQRVAELEAEVDWLKAEIERLKAGGGANRRSPARASRRPTTQTTGQDATNA